MPAAKNFLDSNVLLYLQSADAAKAQAAETLLQAGGVISVQVLNETAAVLNRKFKQPWHDISPFLALVEQVVTVVPMTQATHHLGRQLAERYQLNFYDALIAAAALEAECNVLQTEDLQHGLVIEKTLKVHNPFR
jgi:predicted nucleic acid-binding protein